VAFLRQLGNNRPVRRTLILCRPSSIVQSLIRAAGLGEIARVRPDLPPGWPADHGDPHRPGAELHHRPVEQSAEHRTSVEIDLNARVTLGSASRRR
jgi:hypothetical protein